MFHENLQLQVKEADGGFLVVPKRGLGNSREGIFEREMAIFSTNATELTRQVFNLGPPDSKNSSKFTSAPQLVEYGFS